jgi:hypothetical protein
MVICLNLFHHQEAYEKVIRCHHIYFSFAGKVFQLFWTFIIKATSTEVGGYICNRAPWITHLLFSDDSLIFINACEASATRLNEILNIYNQASGQQVNRSKSSIYFNPCTSKTQMEEVKQVLNISLEAICEKYLGLPTTVGRITDEAFEYITNSARGQMNGWAEKFLAYPGKEVLIKSVIQAKSTYSMSCIELSKGSCNKMVSLIARLWWTGNLEMRSMH